MKLHVLGRREVQDLNFEQGGFELSGEICLPRKNGGQDTYIVHPVVLQDGVNEFIEVRFDMAMRSLR